MNMASIGTSRVNTTNEFNSNNNNFVIFETIYIDNKNLQMTNATQEEIKIDKANVDEEMLLASSSTYLSSPPLSPLSSKMSSSSSSSSLLSLNKTLGGITTVTPSRLTNAFVSKPGIIVLTQASLNELFGSCDVQLNVIRKTGSTNCINDNTNAMSNNTNDNRINASTTTLLTSTGINKDHHNNARIIINNKTDNHPHNKHQLIFQNHNHNLTNVSTITTSSISSSLNTCTITANTSNTNNNNNNNSISDSTINSKNSCINTNNDCTNKEKLNSVLMVNSTTLSSLSGISSTAVSTPAVTITSGEKQPFYSTNKKQQVNLFVISIQI